MSDMVDKLFGIEQLRRINCLMMEVGDDYQRGRAEQGTHRPGTDREQGKEYRQALERMEKPARFRWR
jgi:hypothetical protein